VDLHFDAVGEESLRPSIDPVQTLSVAYKQFRFRQPVLTDPEEINKVITMVKTISIREERVG